MAHEHPQRPPDVRVEAAMRIMTPPERVSIPIPLEDWDSLVNRIETCRVSLQWWSIAYSIALGIGATAGLSIAPIFFSELPDWVLTLYTVICSVGLTSGIILMVAQRALSRGQQSQIDSLLIDMNRTKDSYAPPPIRS